MKKTKTEDPEGFCRPATAADRLGCSVATLYRWVRRGELRVYRRLGRSYFAVEEIEALGQPRP